MNSCSALRHGISTRRRSSRSGHAKTAYLSGTVESARLDVPRLGLTPLGLEAREMWNPAEEFNRDGDDLIPDWAEPMLVWGPRRVYEMEQVLPGDDPDDPWGNPILQAVDRAKAGDRRGGRRILMDLCRQDLRCLDAHSHLGWMAFDRSADEALRHYEVIVRFHPAGWAALVGCPPVIHSGKGDVASPFALRS
jgi:hypothetical protein